MRRATSASAGPLTATTTRSITPKSRGSSAGLGRRLQQLAALAQSPAVFAQRVQRGAARHRATLHRPVAASRVPMKPPMAPAP